MPNKSDSRSIESPFDTHKISKSIHIKSERNTSSHRIIPTFFFLSTSDWFTRCKPLQWSFSRALSLALYLSFGRLAKRLKIIAVNICRFDIVSHHFELRSNHTVTCRTTRDYPWMNTKHGHREKDVDWILDRCLDAVAVVSLVFTTMNDTLSLSLSVPSCAVTHYN